MKLGIVFFVKLLWQLAFANMASPFIDGTRAASPFSSRDVDVRSERIHISLNPAGTDAKFTIDYNIFSRHDGIHIPLLFVALKYNYGFRVWLDGKEIVVTEIPSKFTHFNNSPFEAFKIARSNETNNGGPDEVNILWSDSRSETHTINELMYFEANLSKGSHTIHVEYNAAADLNLGSWVTQRTLRYSLSPAKYWHSFENLSVAIEQHGHPVALNTNLGTPKKTGTLQQWSFSKLPADYIEISYTPEINFFAKILINTGPIVPTVAASALLIWIHLIWIKRYRKRKAFKKFSIAVIIGSVVFPFLFVIAFMLSFPIIDAIIGPDASGRHGYTFLAILIYPVLMPLYWITMWLVDRRFRKRNDGKS